LILLGWHIAGLETILEEEELIVVHIMKTYQLDGNNNKQIKRL